VVVEGLRYGSNPLLTMRIHDITVVADPNRRLHDEPELKEADGTVGGFTPCLAAISLMNGFSAQLDANTTSWWTGWWPLLHMKTNGTPNPDSFYSFELTIDLLGSTSIVEYELETSKDDHLNRYQMESIAAQGIDDFMKDTFPIDAVLIAIAASLYGIIQYYLATMIIIPSPAALLGLTILATAFGLAVWTALLSISDGVLSGRLTPGEGIALVFFGIVIMLIIGCALDHVLQNRILAKYWQMRNLSWGFRAVGLMLLTFYLCAIQFFLLSLALILLMVFVCMSIDYYGIAI
jgi:hypothetical protein